MRSRKAGVPLRPGLEVLRARDFWKGVGAASARGAHGCSPDPAPCLFCSHCIAPSLQNSGLLCFHINICCCFHRRYLVISSYTLRMKQNHGVFTQLALNLNCFSGREHAFRVHTSTLGCRHIYRYILEYTAVET